MPASQFQLGTPIIVHFLPLQERHSTYQDPAQQQEWPGWLGEHDRLAETMVYW